MARVYRARDLHLGREVAVKILLEEVARDADLRERFRREARSAAALAHPNIVQVFDFLETPDGTFLIMELVRGEDLKTRLRRTGPLPVAEAARIGGAVLAALQHAHRQGLIHRDISARNVLLDEAGTVRVSDFGIARNVGDRTLTRAGELLGSVQYMSPEQASGDEAGVEADVYGVGVLLYEMLTGRLPFDADSPVKLALKHLNEQPVPPSEHRAGLPAALDAVILQALEKDPADRFPSAADMAAALSQAAAGAATEQTLLRPAGRPPARPAAAAAPPERPRSALGEREPAEPPRRPGMLWILVGTAVVALLAGLGWVLLTPQGRVQVPDLTGLPLQEARRQAEELGLELRVQEQRASEDAPPDTVLEQRPRAGEMLARGSALYVIVSAGRETVAVPDVSGLTESRAREELTRLGLVLRRATEASKDVPVGVVIRQDPGPGEQVTRGTSIDVVISSGSGKQAVPELGGLSRAEAEKILADLGMSLVVGGTRPDASAAEDTILEQNPSAGTLVGPGQKVKVVLSRGRQGLAAPDLVGKSIGEAREIASGMGLDLVVEGEAGPEDSIETQSPAAGEPVEGGEIRVSARQTAVVPGLQGMTVEQAAAELEQAGLGLGEVSRVALPGGSPGEIVEQDPSQGIEIPRGTKVHVKVADPAAPTPVPPPEPPSPATPTPAASWVP